MLWDFQSEENLILSIKSYPRILQSKSRMRNFSKEKSFINIELFSGLNFASLRLTNPNVTDKVFKGEYETNQRFYNGSCFDGKFAS